MIHDRIIIAKSIQLYYYNTQHKIIMFFNLRLSTRLPYYVLSIRTYTTNVTRLNPQHVVWLQLHETQHHVVPRILAILYLTMLPFCYTLDLTNVILFCKTKINTLHANVIWSLVGDANSPPTRPARSVVAGQRCTPLSLSAYKTPAKHGWWSEMHATHSLSTSLRCS